MLLKITHTTDLAYTDLISESVMELRMVPRQEEDQHRLSFNAWAYAALPAGALHAPPLCGSRRSCPPAPA